jgi:hypothetical protein
VRSRENWSYLEKAGWRDLLPSLYYSGNFISPEESVTASQENVYYSKGGITPFHE